MKRRTVTKTPIPFDLDASIAESEPFTLETLPDVDIELPDLDLGHNLDALDFNDATPPPTAEEAEEIERGLALLDALMEKHRGNINAALREFQRAIPRKKTVITVIPGRINHP